MATKKEQMKEQEGLPSPDLWDAVCMAFLEDAHYVQAEATGPREAPASKAVVNALAAELEAALGL
ncbi:hypothetical protein [Variovorax sp. dw_954]|uniref:hypothetical protein n=1 Tax=Variovorax sp. dw_954 TaxID=2720078 RepID=UPI001BD658B0|nr:hypothetical protein [Variovorax sp. dw_954]